MNLYKIYQDTNSDCDTYDSAIVAAESEEDARNTHPHGNDIWNGKTWGKDEEDGYNPGLSTWTKPEHVGVLLIGVASENTKPGVVLASFNAG